jgi:ADP-heptose:LPS heptosyltransferase
MALKRLPRSYDGEDLGPRPHIAVLFCDHIGDFVVATPLMRGLRERFPDLVLDYFGGEATRELEEASRLVDARYSLFGRPDAMDVLPSFLAERRAAAGSYALAVNLEADPKAAAACQLIDPAYLVSSFLEPGEQGEADALSGIDRLKSDVWNRPDLLRDYPELTSQYITEIFCRLARVETDYAVTEAPAQEPRLAVPPVLLSTGGNRTAKLWPTAHWLEVAEWLREHHVEAGLLGPPPERRVAYHANEVDDALLRTGVADLRGRLSLPEVAGALRAARAFVTVDSGLLHLGIAVGAPTIGLFGASPVRLWAPPVAHATILHPSNPCSLCEENRFRNTHCLLPLHQCMLSVEPARVIATLQALVEGDPMSGGSAPA